MRQNLSIICKLKLNKNYGQFSQHSQQSVEVSEKKMQGINKTSNYLCMKFKREEKKGKIC